MREIRGTLFALTLLSGGVLAAQPNAVVTGPQTAKVGQEFFLKVRGSITDPDMPLIVMPAKQPVSAAAQSSSFFLLNGNVSVRETRLRDASFPIEILYDDKGAPAYAAVTVQRAGTYIFLVEAMGKVGDPPAFARSLATWTVEVAGDSPGPNPDPTPVPDPLPGPTPGPTPDPLPPPGPAPVAGELWGVLVLPAAPTPAQSALRTDPALRRRFAETKTNFLIHNYGDAEISTPQWSPLILQNQLPSIFWIDSAGKILRTTQVRDSSSILADITVLRGR